MKKLYVKPSMKAHKMQASKIICVSSDEPRSYPGSFSYAPNLHQENHMA